MRGPGTPGKNPDPSHGEVRGQTEGQGLPKGPRGVARALAEDRVWRLVSITTLGYRKEEKIPSQVRMGLQHKRPQLTLLSIGL